MTSWVSLAALEYCAMGQRLFLRLITWAPNQISASVEWLDRVVENIEHELDVIDRKRILWLTVAAAGFAALAVFVGVVAIVISLFLRS